MATGSQRKGKIGPAPEILEVLGAGPEVLTDIDGDEAPGGSGKEIAGGQVENGADPAELVVVQPSLANVNGFSSTSKKILQLPSGCCISE